MNLQQIVALLEAKFKGERKDGLTLLARHIVMTAGETDDEKAKEAVEALTEDGVKNFIKEWRKDADAETTKAVQTNEQTLRNKYNFVEKGEPKPPTPPEDKNEPNKPFSKEDIQAAINDALKPYIEKVNQLEGASETASRRQQVEDLFKDRKVNAAYKKAIMAGFDNRTFENKEAFDAFLAETKTDVESCEQELVNEGLSAMGDPLFAKTNQDGVSTEVAQYIADAKKAEEGESPLSGKKV